MMLSKKKFWVAGFWILFVIIGRFLKLNLPVGEHSAMISCFSVALPLVVVLFPARVSLPLAGGLWAAISLFFPFTLTAGIPTILATLSWQLSGEREFKSWAYHMIVPVIAMALFIVSDYRASAYALYWVIPMAGLFFKPSLFVRALQSTFIAHAAGSVIWAYRMPLSTETWLSLMPVVAVERLLSALLAVTLLWSLNRLSVFCCERFALAKALERSA